MYYRFFVNYSFDLLYFGPLSINEKVIYVVKWLTAGLKEFFRLEEATNGKMDGRWGSEFELAVDDQKVVIIIHIL